MRSIVDTFKVNDEFSEEIMHLLQQYVTKKIVHKGTILVNVGEIMTKTYFVQKGLLRSYTVDEKGKEHIFMFAPENWIMSDISAHTYDTPSELFIDALEDSEIEVMDKNFIEKVISLDKELAPTEISKLMKRISVLQRRILLLMSASAKKRYQDFIEIYPNIVQRVPQKMIASYLGITPEALSKIRGDMAREK